MRCTALVAEGAITLPDGAAEPGHRGAPAPEGPRRLRHQRRAPAGQAGRHQPARLRRAGGREADRLRRASPTSRSPVPASSTSPSRRVPRARSRPTSSRRGSRTAPPTLRRREDQPRVRLRQPDRAAPPRGVPLGRLGDALARMLQAAGAEVTREYYFNDHGAQIDRFSSSLMARALGLPVPEDGYERRRTSPTSPPPSSPSSPSVLDLPDDGARRWPSARRVCAPAQGAAGPARTASASTSTSTSHEATCSRRASQGSVAAADRAQDNGHLSRPTARCGCGPTDVRRRQGPRASSGPTARAAYSRVRPGLLPRQARARASTAASTMLGADHHGYVGRMNAMCAAFGDEPGKNLES